MKVKKEILRSDVTSEIIKIKEYDENGNLIYFKDIFDGKDYEEWREYDDNNNLIRTLDSNNLEINNTYDDNGIRIHNDVYEYEFYPEKDNASEFNYIKSYIINEIEKPKKEKKFSFKNLISKEMTIMMAISCFGLGSIVTSVILFILVSHVFSH